MMLVDRDKEIATFENLFQECERGKRLVAVVQGPVGSGKTALLQVFADRVSAAGATFLSAVASRGERGLALGVLSQLFRGRAVPAAVAARAAALIEDGAPTSSGTLPGQQAMPGPEAVRPESARVFEGLLGLVAELSECGPVVIAVDDLQHVDVASLQCLSYLARRTAALPVLMLLTECAYTLPADRQLHAELTCQGDCHGIPLGSLPLSGVAQMLAKHLDGEAARLLAADCRALTGGNPLLVRAVGKDSAGIADESGAGLLPGAAFRSAVVACLHRHEPATVELGQAIAILGQAATLGMLSELLAVSPESAARGLYALSSAGLLDESGQFRHEQARQAVLGHMTGHEREVMHGSAVQTLYRAGAASMTLAGHIMAAGRLGTPWAVAALREAADQALADGESERAIDYLRRAESECTDDRQRAAIIFSYVSVKWPLEPECVTRHLSELVIKARAGLLDSECLRKLAHYLLWMGDTENGAEILAKFGIGSTEIAVGRGPFRSPEELLYPDAISRVRSAIADVKNSARTPAWPWPHQVGSLPPVANHDREATVIAAERSLSECMVNGPTLASAVTALMALISEEMLDRTELWCDLLLWESEAFRGGPLWRAVLTAFLAMIEFRRGDLAAAEDHGRKALTFLTRKSWGVAIGGPLSSLVLSTTASGKHADAAAFLRTPVPEAMFGTFYGLLYLYARGEYHLATERPQAALADFSDCGKRMMMWGLDLPGLIPWRAKAAEAHLVIGDSLAARELSEEQLVRAGTRFSRTRGISLRALALTSHLAERTALLRESAELLRDSGARLELTYTFVELSKAHLALGEHTRARWAARHARDLAERCGVQLPAATLSKAETGPGKSGNGASAKSLAQLSEAEQRVAVLAAYGYTNGQIAQKLYITVSTVERHLTRVYRKLGVVGRVELPVDVLSPRGLPRAGASRDVPASGALEADALGQAVQAVQGVGVRGGHSDERADLADRAGQGAEL